MLTQSTAMSRARHVRRSGGTGARSGLLYSEAATSRGSVLAAAGAASSAALIVAALSFIVQPFYGPNAPTASVPFVYYPGKEVRPSLTRSVSEGGPRSRFGLVRIID